MTISFTVQSGTSSAPAITSQPVSQTVSVGQSAVFTTVTASGNHRLPTSGRKRRDRQRCDVFAYTTPPAAATDNGAAFTSIVNNSIGSVTSSTATLTVTSASSGNVRFRRARLGQRQVPSRRQRCSVSDSRRRGLGEPA